MESHFINVQMLNMVSTEIILKTEDGNAGGKRGLSYVQGHLIFRYMQYT
jgi:hypothetical protein